MIKKVKLVTRLVTENYAVPDDLDSIVFTRMNSMGDRLDQFQCNETHEISTLGTVNEGIDVIEFGKLEQGSDVYFAYTDEVSRYLIKPHNVLNQQVRELQEKNEMLSEALSRSKSENAFLKGDVLKLNSDIEMLEYMLLPRWKKLANAFLKWLHGETV